MHPALHIQPVALRFISAEPGSFWPHREDFLGLMSDFRANAKHLRRGVPGDVWTWPGRSQKLFQRTKLTCTPSQKIPCPEQISRAHRARPARSTTAFKGRTRAYSHTARRLFLFVHALFFLLAPTPKPGSTLYSPPPQSPVRRTISLTSLSSSAPSLLLSPFASLNGAVPRRWPPSPAVWCPAACSGP